MYVRISDTKVVAIGGASHKAHLKSLETPKAKQPKAKQSKAKTKPTEE